jgi:hypothetical protein
MPLTPTSSSRESVANMPASLVSCARTTERVRLLRSVLALTSARTAPVVASPARLIAATALGSQHLSPPFILRL